MPATATAPQTLLDFLLHLLGDDDARAAFQADPQGTLAAAGLNGLCLSDVRDAMPLVMDHAPAEVAARYDEDVRAGTATTSASVAEEAHHGGVAGDGGTTPVGPGGHGVLPVVPGMDDVIGHLQVVTNNYAFDSHDITYSSPVTQTITAGGDVTATVDVAPVVAGGEGSVAAGGDITGPTATGGGVAGDGNMINGSGQAAFGDGNATGSVAAGAGAAVSTADGTATGNHADTSAYGSGSGNVSNGGDATDDHADNSIDDHSTSDDHTDNSDNSIDDHSNTNTPAADDGGAAAAATTAAADDHHTLFADEQHDTTTDHAGEDAAADHLVTHS